MAVTQPDGYWKFDEASGNAADATANGNTLTNNGSATYGVGALNNCVDLTTTGKYMTHATNAILQPTTSLSLSFWAYLNSLPGVSEWAYFSNADISGTNRDFYLEFGGNSNGLYSLISSNGGSTINEFDSATSILPATGAWHHYAFVVDVAGGAITAYIDNVTKTMTRRGAQAVSALSTTATTTAIGAAFGNLRTGDWKFDEYGYWKNYKLTASEVTTLYNSGTPPSYASLFGGGVNSGFFNLMRV